MAQKRKSDQTKLKPGRRKKASRKTDAQIADAAISLADAQGWAHVTAAAVARRAKCKTTDVEAAFPDTFAIVRWHLEHIGKNTRAEVEAYLEEDNWRDNLMEILMVRFELAQPHRAAWASLPEAFRAHPRKLRRFVRPFHRAVRDMLKLAGIAHPRRRPLLTAAFGTLYLSLIHAWMEDETPDLSKTMAAIDKRLGLLEKIDGYTDCGARKAR